MFGGQTLKKRAVSAAKVYVYGRNSAEQMAEIQRYLSRLRDQFDHAAIMSRPQRASTE